MLDVQCPQSKLVPRPSLPMLSVFEWGSYRILELREVFFFSEDETKRWVHSILQQSHLKVIEWFLDKQSLTATIHLSFKHEMTCECWWCHRHQVGCYMKTGTCCLPFWSLPMSEGKWAINKSKQSAGERNSNPFQYSCLEDSMDRETWQSMWLQESWTWLSD